MNNSSVETCVHKEEGEVYGGTQTDISCGQLLELERERQRGIKIKRWTDMRKCRRIIPASP